MESDYEHRLENAVHRELRSLPELEAPKNLGPNVMAAIRACSVLPWYRRPWPVWPKALQAASLILMLALFGGLCFAVWELSQAQSAVKAMKAAGQWVSMAGLIWTTLGALGSAILAFVKELNTAFVIAGIFIAVFSYAACIGLGTVFFRFARHQ